LYPCGNLLGESFKLGGWGLSTIVICKCGEREGMEELRDSIVNPDLLSIQLLFPIQKLFKLKTNGLH
jgi:hypothetical protein